MGTKFEFSIDRGGTFTDIYARCPGGRIRTLKLLSSDPDRYPDAPTEGIRRILEQVCDAEKDVDVLPCNVKKHVSVGGQGL